MHSNNPNFQPKRKKISVRRLLGYLAPVLFLSASQLNAQGSIQGFDYYSPVVEWQQASGLDVAPIHGGLLPNGKLYFLSVYKFFKYPNQDLTDPGFVPEFMFTMDPSPAYLTPPATVMVEPMVTPIPGGPLFDPQANSVTFKSLVCSGHSLMDDGSLFFASGAEAVIDLDLYNSGNLAESVAVDGLTESLSYDSFTDSWIQNPDIVGTGPLENPARRWYATVTRLADSRMLVTGGYEKVLPSLSHNTSVELFDPATNAWSLLSDINDTPPGIENPDYTHVFQFPYDYSNVDPETGETTEVDVVLMMGGSGEPLLLVMDDQNKFWHHTQNHRPGALEFIQSSSPKKVFPNHGSSSVMLPLRLPEDDWGYGNGSILTVGGAHFTPMEGNADVYDPIADSWRPSISLEGLRHHAATVLLPDGRVLILGGHDDVSAATQTGYAQYIDPKNNFSLAQGKSNMPEVRGYHGVAVLLPDGRVLLGGGNPSGQQGFELTDFRYYYPEYMFQPRPRIAYTADTINMTQYSILFLPHQTVMAEAALISLGSMTHSFDQNQRNLQLRVFDLAATIKLIDGNWELVGPEECTDDPSLCLDAKAIQAPDTPEIAPPGHYMLFILDDNRVPSIGKIVKLAL